MLVACAALAACGADSETEQPPAAEAEDPATGAGETAPAEGGSALEDAIRTFIEGAVIASPELGCGSATVEYGIQKCEKDLARVDLDGASIEDIQVDDAASPPTAEAALDDGSVFELVEENGRYSITKITPGAGS